MSSPMPRGGYEAAGISRSSGWRGGNVADVSAGGLVHLSLICHISEETGILGDKPLQNSSAFQIVKINKFAGGTVMKLRKIVATITIAALFFWAPSAIPVRATGIGPCGIGAVWLTADTAFAQGVIIPCPVTPTSPTPWPVIVIGASVVSVILNAIIISNTQCRELTQQEAISSIFLPFIGIAMNQKMNKCHH
jgi:hypothetical protein